MKTIIFDIDGVLANNEDFKDWFDEKGNFDTEAFGDKVMEFSVLEWGKALLQSLQQEYNIVISTGRHERYKDETVEWLADNDIEYDEIHFRTSKNNTETHKIEVAAKYDVLMIIDDCPSVVKVCREAGYTVLQPNHFYGDDNDMS